MTYIKTLESLDGAKGLNRKVFMNLNYLKVSQGGCAKLLLIVQHDGKTYLYCIG